MVEIAGSDSQMSSTTHVKSSAECVAAVTADDNRHISGKLSLSHSNFYKIFTKADSSVKERLAVG